MGNVPKSDERQFVRINIIFSYSRPAYRCRALYLYPRHASDNTDRFRHRKPLLFNNLKIITIFYYSFISIGTRPGINGHIPG